MHDDMLGDDLLGDELLGDDLMGDDLIVGDDLLGDDLLGDDLLGGSDLIVGADDLLGDDLIVGDDLLGDDIIGDDIIGAWRRQQRRKRRALGKLGKIGKLARKRNLIKRAVLAKKLQGAKVLESEKPRHARVQSMGLSYPGVPAGGKAVDIVARPQEMFKPRRLVIPSTIAGNFMIEDVKVGRTSQFVSSARQPALVFSELSTGDNFSLKLCKPGMDIVLKISNVGEEDADFDCAIIGDVIE